MLSLKSQQKNIDTSLFITVLILTVIGVLMVYEASAVTAFKDFGDKYFYARQQSLWALIGFVVMVVLSKVNYKIYKKISPFLMLLTIILLVVVLIPGIGIKVLGARRWIDIGFITFQPAELTKLTLVMYLSAILSVKPKIIPFVSVLGILLVLVMLEPDLGTTVILLSSGFFVYFASGAELFSLLIILISGMVGGIGLILTSSYRRERLMTFLDPGRDPLGASYHIRQVLLALGSGGIMGLGLGASRQKYAYLPEAMTDSIFAIVGEEFGFIGSVALILIFLYIIWKGFKIAQESPDKFGHLLAIGITSWIGIQALVNLSAMVALVPLTGVPLPFVSSGGSSLIMVLAGIGILLNISRQRVITK